MNFTQLIYESCKAKPGKELIHWPEGSGFPVTTSDELLKDFSYRRVVFRVAGFRPGMRLMLMQSISPDIVATMLAIMAEGYTVVLPPANAGWRIFFDIRRQAGVDGVVMVPGVSRILRFLMWVLRIPTLRFPKQQKARLDINELPPVDVADEAIALISFSSGSTRKSQPIFRSHGLLRAQHEAIGRQFPAFEGQIDLPLFPNILLHHLATASACVIPNILNWKLTNLDPEHIIVQIEKCGINTLTGNVHYFSQLARTAQGRNFTKVKACGIGGSPVPEYLLVEIKSLFPNADCYVIYGATEAEPIAVRRYQDTMSPWKGYAVGKPVEGIEMILQPTFPLSLGSEKSVMAGEIHVRGAHVVSGSAAWHPTGDYGYFQNGELFLTARKGNESVVGGWQHYPIEHALRQVDGVKQVAALAKNGVFEIHYAGACHVNELRKHLLEKLPEKYMGKITKHQSLPVDQRHLSKILYQQI